MKQGDWIVALDDRYGLDGKTITKGNEYYVHRVQRTTGELEVDCDDDIRRWTSKDTFALAQDVEVCGVCIEAKGSLVSKGALYTMMYCPSDGSMFNVVCNDGEKRMMLKSRFTIKHITKQEDNKMRHNASSTSSTWAPAAPKRHNAHQDWKNYQFDVRSLDQIDHDTIGRDLSWTNPMMILEYGDKDNVMVYLDDSIWRKASASGKMVKRGLKGHKYKVSKLRERLIDMVYNEDHFDPDIDAYMFPRERLPELIALVKEIKNAKWNRPNQTTCTVHKISI